MVFRLFPILFCIALFGNLTPGLEPLISEAQIARRLKETARQINKDYTEKDLVIVMVLKGSLCLVADLIRELDVPHDIETIQCSSYKGSTKRGEMRVFGIDRIQVQDRDVLVVDDIFDSGNTMKTVCEVLKEQHPRSIKACVLLYKNNVPKVTDLRPDYVLFEIDNLFVVGYGLDFEEKYRGLPGVYVMEEL